MRVLCIQADGKGINLPEFLKQLALALHHGHRGGRADVAEPQNGGPVRDDGDGIFLDRQVKRLFRVLMYRLANAGDARCVCHREVRARLELHFRGDLDLAAQMHEERSVADICHLDAVDVPYRTHYLLVVALASGIHRYVADQEILADADNIDALDVAAGLADGRRDLAELTRLILDLNAKGKAITRVRCWCVGHNQLRITNAGFPVIRNLKFVIHFLKSMPKKQGEGKLSLVLTCGL